MWRNCGGDGGGSADRTLIKRPREFGRSTILGAWYASRSLPLRLGFLSEPALHGVPWISCRTVLCCSESDGADRFERNTGTRELELDASSSTSNGTNLVAPDCLEGPGVPELLSYSGGLVIELSILLGS